MKYKSHAEWPVELGLPNNQSEDAHDSQAAAEAVCTMLQGKGFGGDGKVFPVRTWVEPIFDLSVLLNVANQLRTQDNRITQNPMFCVQEKKRDVGYDSDYADNPCWYNSEEGECVYEEPADLEGWEQYGYKDRWETVMVAFTEKGCQEYLDLNGHNHRGEVRIYAESFNRCPEMIAIREFLLALGLNGVRPTISQS